jgi:hypothetical protein
LVARTVSSPALARIVEGGASVRGKRFADLTCGADIPIRGLLCSVQSPVRGRLFQLPALGTMGQVEDSTAHKKQ